MVKMRIVSIVGMLLGVMCLGAATAFVPGGFDWNRDYISTMLRGPSGPTRMLADAGAILFCLSFALIFARLAKAPELSRVSKCLSIGGIGSAVYSSLAVTPLHDLVVTISLLFFMAAVVPLVWVLYALRELRLFLLGFVCLVVFIASATIYYSGHFNDVLPWGQRLSYTLIAVWLVSLDWAFPRVLLASHEREFT